MRIELRDGQWADLRERITHADDKAIRKARAHGATDTDAIIEAMTLLVRIFVRDWHVTDPDGKPIALADPDAIDRAPEDIVDRLFEESATLYRGATVPNSPTPPSSDA